MVNSRMSSRTVFEASAAATKVIRSFWLIGLLNNAPWVLMLACAPSIFSGGVALVFLSNQIPGLLVKITAPYWFHRVSYKFRMLMASMSMCIACLLVGFGALIHDEVNAREADSNHNIGLAMELVGVSFISFQCSLGEASSLALAGKFDSVILPKMRNSTSYSIINSNACNGTDSYENDYEVTPQRDLNTIQMNRCITAFSSGTGLAGIVGYGYKSLLSKAFGWGLSYVVFSVVVFAAAYYATFYHGLFKAEHEDRFDRLVQAGDREKVLAQKKTTPVHMLESSFPRNRRMREDDESTSEAVEMVVHFQESTSLQSTESAAIYNLPAQLTPVQRFRLVLSLWPYTIPLFTVYAAEYMMQAGVWSAIGFPVESQTARAQFYHYSNWMYQVGVFVSRSSGNLFSASLPILWLMPALQVINLVFFCMTSIHHFVYSWWLLLPAFCAGLLGGGVYVQGFSRINMDMPLELREFAISSAGVADSLGILTADISALFIQSCIYDKNNIQGAVVSCPVG